VICVGSSGPGQAGQLAVWLEEQIRATAPPQIGTDVKVMVVRDRSAFDVTVALPVHPETVASWRDYADVIGEYSEVLSGDLKSRCAATVRVNTKDVPGRGYLAPFGTSLGKGDCGAVGRGNRSYGVIEPLRASSCEAPAGKNPVHHGGKIYSALAGQAARAIADKTGHPAQVTIAARNGEALDDPAYVLVAVADDSDRRLIEDTVREIISAATGYCADFLGTDPITRFRAGRA
jgi:S-adenosylmethionine synthetase